MDEALGFALTWNYWANDAISTASDVIALQVLLEFWTENFPGWALTLICLAVVVGLNLCSVKLYGEVSSLNMSPDRGMSLMTLLDRVLAVFAQGCNYCGRLVDLLPHLWCVSDLMVF